MKKVILALMLGIFAMPSFARAGGKFGLEDNMHVLLPIDYTAEDGSKFNLSYHTQTRYFVAGIYIKEVGYALTVRGQDKYKSLDESTIAILQAENILPTPLPEYKLTVMDYVFGYSLWIILAVIILWAIISKKFKNED